jgi:hypothetical protein
LNLFSNARRQSLWQMSNLIKSIALLYEAHGKHSMMKPFCQAAFSPAERSLFRFLACSPAKMPSTKVSLTVARGTQQQTVQVTLGERPVSA